MEISDLQGTLRETFGERDAARGVDGTFRWMVEEVGELARAIRDRDTAALTHEVSDVLAWLGSLANVLGIDLQTAVERYAQGCPRCAAKPCVCPPG